MHGWLHGRLISLTDAATQAEFLLGSILVPDQDLDAASQQGCFHDSIHLLLPKAILSFYLGFHGGLVGLDEGLEHEI